MISMFPKIIIFDMSEMSQLKMMFICFTYTRVHTSIADLNNTRALDELETFYSPNCADDSRTHTKKVLSLQNAECDEAFKSC